MVLANETCWETHHPCRNQRQLEWLAPPFYAMPDRKTILEQIEQSPGCPLHPKTDVPIV